MLPPLPLPPSARPLSTFIDPMPLLRFFSDEMKAQRAGWADYESLVLKQGAVRAAKKYKQSPHSQAYGSYPFLRVLGRFNFVMIQHTGGLLLKHPGLRTGQGFQVFTKKPDWTYLALANGMPVNTQMKKRGYAINLFTGRRYKLSGAADNDEETGDDEEEDEMPEPPKRAALATAIRNVAAGIDKLGGQKRVRRAEEVSPKAAAVPINTIQHALMVGAAPPGDPYGNGVPSDPLANGTPPAPLAALGYSPPKQEGAEGRQGVLMAAAANSDYVGHLLASQEKQEGAADPRYFTNLLASKEKQEDDDTLSPRSPPVERLNAFMEFLADEASAIQAEHKAQQEPPKQESEAPLPHDDRLLVQIEAKWEREAKATLAEYRKAQQEMQEGAPPEKQEGAPANDAPEDEVREVYTERRHEVYDQEPFFGDHNSDSSYSGFSGLDDEEPPMPEEKPEEQEVNPQVYAAHAGAKPVAGNSPGKSEVHAHMAPPAAPPVAPFIPSLPEASEEQLDYLVYSRKLRDLALHPRPGDAIAFCQLRKGDRVCIWDVRGMQQWTAVEVVRIIGGTVAEFHDGSIAIAHQFIGVLAKRGE